MDAAIVTSGYPSNEQFPEYNLSKKFNMNVYTSEKDGDSANEIDVERVDITLPPVIGQRLYDTIERLVYSFWKPPVEHDIIITSGLSTQSLVTWPEQHRIHYFHGIHRGSFGFPARDDYSDNSLMRMAQHVNRNLIRVINSVSFDYIDTIVANSTFTKRMIERQYGVTADVIIQPSFINIDKYICNSDREEYYLYLGRLADEKGVIEIIEAFNILDLPLRVAGKGPLKQELISRSNDNIKIIGYISEERKRNLLSNCKGLIHNTIAEPFGVVLVEALRSGAPVIGADTGNTPNIIETNKTGVLFTRENGGKTYQRPQSAEPIIKAVKKADTINWNHNYISSSVEKYGSERLINKWADLLESVQ